MVGEGGGKGLWTYVPAFALGALAQNWVLGCRDAGAMGCEEVRMAVWRIIRLTREKPCMVAYVGSCPVESDLVRGQVVRVRKDDESWGRHVWGRLWLLTSGNDWRMDGNASKTASRQSPVFHERYPPSSYGDKQSPARISFYARCLRTIDVVGVKNT